MSAEKPRPIAAEERVFSLILALVASPNGLTKHELLSSVHGYANEYSAGGDNASLERKFERDKDQLRTLGIPLETIDSPNEPGNNQLTRYRISKNRLQLPATLRFTREELMLLRAAALSWSEGSLSQEARRAVIKLDSLGTEVDTRQLGVAPSLNIDEPYAVELQQAIQSGHSVEFRYRRPDQAVATRRTVAPLRLHRADGRWHLVAHDFGRDAPRVFLLRRILGPLKRSRSAVRPEMSDDVAAAIDELERLQSRQPATVMVKRGSVAAARLDPRARARDHADEYDTLRINTLDYRALAEELVGYGPDVKVLGPSQLDTMVRSIIEEILTMHTETVE